MEPAKFGIDRLSSARLEGTDATGQVWVTTANPYCKRPPLEARAHVFEFSFLFNANTCFKTGSFSSSAPVYYLCSPAWYVTYDMQVNTEPPNRRAATHWPINFRFARPISVKPSVYSGNDISMTPSIGYFSIRQCLPPSSRPPLLCPPPQIPPSQKSEQAMVGS